VEILATYMDLLDAFQVKDKRKYTEEIYPTNKCSKRRETLVFLALVDSRKSPIYVTFDVVIA
jgi:hypothetical protein